MTVLELDPSALEIRDEIFRSFDGQTAQQREQTYFYEKSVEPRLSWVTQLAVWDAVEPHIVRGTE